MRRRIATGALLLAGSALSLSAAAGPGRPGVAVPLYAVDGRCADPRFPRLAGPWVVGCGSGGAVDRALSLETGRVVALPRPLERAGTGPGHVVAFGLEGGLFRLTEEGVVEVPDTTRVTEALLAPPTTDGTHVALLSARGLQAFAATDRTRSIHTATAMGWQAPALAWPLVAWVEDAGEGDADLWIRDTRDRGAARMLSGGTGRQDRVRSAGPWLAWVDAGDVVLHDTRDGATRRIPAETGFRAAPAPWDGEACWEVRGDGVDIACSDLPGVHAAGHQGWPDRWGPWLLYRDGERPMLYTAADPAE